MGVERTKPSTTAVIVIDVQEKLAPTMPPERLAELERAARILVGAAKELGAPVIATEQYPRGLGPTLPSLRALYEEAGITPIEKLTFSSCNEPRFVQALKDCKADAAVVLGMETHICVFQTVRDLLARGLRVDVPIDGVASRRDDHRDVGLELCQRAGAVVTTAETVLFDWMVQAGTDTFKRLSKLVR
jgi:nicotinamidase-related amidase